MIIAVDGPAASGKGTLAAGLAAHYRLPHLDTGLLYRAVGLAARAHLDTPGFEAAAVAAAQALDAAHLDNLDALTSAEAGALASKVARIRRGAAGAAPVSARFRRTSRAARCSTGAISARVICPDADVKLFIEADSKSRMERRARQLEAKGHAVDRYALYHQIEERDARDRTNPNGRLLSGARRPLAGHHAIGYRRRTPRGRRHCRRGHGREGEAFVSL